jgi:hypothetical protein
MRSRMLAPEAFQRAVADGQIELADEAARAKTVKRFAQLDELGFEGWRSFLVLMVPGTQAFEQAGRAAQLEAASHLRTVGAVVAKSRALGLMPRCLALSTRRRGIRCDQALQFSTKV